MWQDSPFHSTVDLDDLKVSIDRVQAEVNAYNAECGATAGRAKGVSPDYLSKIRSIDHKTAKRTIGITSQYLKHEEAHSFGQRYSTNDRMLQY